MVFVAFLLQLYLCWTIVWCVQTFLLPSSSTSATTNHQQQQQRQKPTLVNNSHTNLNEQQQQHNLLKELKDTREALIKDLEEINNNALLGSSHFDDDATSATRVSTLSSLEENNEWMMDGVAAMEDYHCGSKTSNDELSSSLLDNNCYYNDQTHTDEDSNKTNLHECYQDDHQKEGKLVELIQAIIRSNQAATHFLEKHSSIELIGQLCRNYLERKEYDQERNRLSILQSLIKRRFNQQLLRKELEKLNMITAFLQSKHIQNCIAESIVRMNLIQSLIRGNSQYCHFRNTVKSSISVQSYWKSEMRRKEIGEIRETCQTIQSFSRGRTMRDQFTQYKQGAIGVQSTARRFLICRLVKSDLASIEIIQSCLTGRNANNTFVDSISSIKTIQAVLIGRLELFKTKELKQTKRKVDCTSMIQTLARGILVRNVMNSQRYSVLTVQSFIRADSERKLLQKALQEQEFLNNVTQVQSIVRGRIEEKTLAEFKNMVTLLQSSIRNHKERKCSKNSFKSLELIQSILRGIRERREYYVASNRFKILQTCLQAQLTRNYLSTYKNASHIVGAISDNYLTNRKFKEEKQRVSHLEAASTGFLLRKNHVNSINTILIIQASIRAAIVTKKANKVRNDLISIQSLQRGYICMKQASLKVESVLYLTGSIIGKLERANLLRTKMAMDNIQAAVKGSIERNKIKKMHKLTENVQALRERKIFEKLYQDTIQHVVLIQSLIRRNRASTPKLAFIIQSNAKGYLARRTNHNQFEKIKTLSGFLQSDRIRHLKKTNIDQIINLQTIIRGKLSRKYNEQEKYSLLCLQGLIRGYLWRNESYFYLPNTSLEVAPISVTETIKRIFEDEVSEDSSESSTETIPPSNRRTPSFDAVTGGRSKLSQLIKEKITKSPVLDLSNMNIESLPTINTDCSHITDLNLSRNMLVTLPEWFCDKFPNLKRLNLSGNRFFDTNKLLSENLSPISQKLTYLDLSKNRLEYFELHYIDENDNVLTTNFPNLKSLNLSYNQLLNVSSEMFELVAFNKLESLDLSHNQLLTFPTLKSSDLLKRWKDFKFINLEHNSFLQSEIGKIFYMFKKRPDILNQLKSQLYKRGGSKEKTESKPIDDLELNSEINILMDEDTQSEMTEMAYHDIFKNNLTSLGSVRTINTASDYDSDDDLMTDRSFYSSTSNLSSDRGISSPSLAQIARKNRANSSSPLMIGSLSKEKNDSTEKNSECSLRADQEEKDSSELDSPKTPRLELLGHKPISINVLTPNSGQTKYSFIQDIPLVQSTTTPTFTPPDYDTKTVMIPKLNFDSSLSPHSANNQLTLNAADNFLSTRSVSSDNMSTPTTSLASPIVESENLLHVLNNESLKESFKDFCKKEHSVESIEFYDAVATFKKLSNPVEIRDLACTIYDLFINPIGKQALNINKKQIDRVKLELFKEDGTLTEVVSTGTFDSLLYCVKMNLMDPLKRYKSTEQFKKLEELTKMSPVDIPLPRPKWGTARHPLLKVGEPKKQFRRRKIPYLFTPKTSNTSSSSEDRTPTNPQASISPLPERKSINIKQMKNRINNLMEILHSERKYLSFLIDLWEMYYTPLVENKYLKGTEQPVSKKRKSSSEPTTINEDPSPLKRKLSIIDKIFNKQKSLSSLKDEDKRMVSKKDALEMFPANLFTIITFNKSFLVSLEERFALYSEEEGSIIPRMYNMMIGDIFEKSIPYFRIYENYLETYESCMNKIRQARAQNKEFDSWIKKRKSHPRSRNLEINSLLVVPVQRVVRYKLLIENLLETTEEDHPDHIRLLKALDMIVDVANQQNNNIRLTNNRVKVRMLTQLFNFYEELGASSISSGGVVEDNLLIREGDVEIQVMKDEKSSPKISNKVQRAYLFTNVIIFVEKTKRVDKQITQEENSKSTENSQGETNTNIELRKSSSFIMKKLKRNGSETNLTNSSPTHRTIKVEKKHFRLEDAFVSGGSALTIEIRFTSPSLNSLKSFSTSDLSSVGSFNIGTMINSARSAKSSSSESTDDLPDIARKRSFSLFGKLTGKHKKQTNISRDQTVMVLSFDSSELKNEWLSDLEISIKEAKQRAANKANKLQISSSLTN